MTPVEPFRITVDGQFEFEIDPERAHQLDLARQVDGAFHLLHNGRSYHAELLEADYPNRTFTLRVDGQKYTVHIADRYERLIHQLGLHTAGTHRENQVKAPMPGLVLHVLVESGQDIAKGDALLILEAMKMENVIKAAGEGRVRRVAVQKGEAVEKGALLIELEDIVR